MRKVIYTSIFGGYNALKDPIFLPEGYDFIAFTDIDLKSNVWEVRKKPSIYNDNTRNAKKYKILPHRFLSDYDISIYIDGNYVIKNDVNELVEKFLQKANAAFYDHNQQPLYDKRNCIYQEAEAIFNFGNINMKKNPKKGFLNFKDDPRIIQKQIKRYHNEGYPPNNGLINGGIILRKHNENDCVKVMESWWEEIKYNSKRDQLSFNYVAWKNNFNFNYLEGHDRTNHYFNFSKHTKK